MRLLPSLQQTLVLLLLCLTGCGQSVIHERLVPIRPAGDKDGVMIPCAQGHIRVLPIQVNTRHGRQGLVFDHFTFAVEYSGMPGTCTTGDVTLGRTDTEAFLPVEAVVKSRRYPDRPGTLTCWYRMRNALETGRTYRLNLHPGFIACPSPTIRYRYELQDEFRWPVEK